MKLKHEELLSNFGFKFNLRRYSGALRCPPSQANENKRGDCGGGGPGPGPGPGPGGLAGVRIPPNPIYRNDDGLDVASAEVEAALAAAAKASGAGSGAGWAAGAGGVGGGQGVGGMGGMGGAAWAVRVGRPGVGAGDGGGASSTGAGGSTPEELGWDPVDSGVSGLNGRPVVSPCRHSPPRHRHVF